MSITIVLGFALRYGYASDSIVVVQYFLLSVRTFFFLRSLFPFHPFFPFRLYVSPPPVVHAQAHDMKSCIPVFSFLSVCLPLVLFVVMEDTLYPLPMRREWISISLFIPSPPRLGSCCSLLAKKKTAPPRCALFFATSCCCHCLSLSRSLYNTLLYACCTFV